MAGAFHTEEIIREGLIVTVGHNMFSLPKLQWFSLRTTGLFYTARVARAKIREVGFEGVMDFETMFVRVEKIDEMNSKFCYGDDKVAIYCLRVGDKRKCRTLCFVSWEERDFWVISILHAIAQFKITNQGKVRSYGGKIRCNSSTSLRRSRSKIKHNPVTTLRHTRSECDRESRSKPSTGIIRKRFSSLRSRKSFRDSRDGDFNEAPRLRFDAFDAGGNFSQSLRHSFSSHTEEPCSPLYEMPELSTEEVNLPPSPRHRPWYGKLSPSMDFGMKRHFSSFMTKFA